MFVQIGYTAFNPEQIVHVDILDELGVVKITTTATRVFDDDSGEVAHQIRYTGDDYHAFMDWWTRCANVSKFPNGSSVIPSLTEDQIRHAQELGAQMAHIRSQDAPSADEWEDVAEIEEELAEMFCNILPAKEGPCST
jgi:hypothetical protein